MSFLAIAISIATCSFGLGWAGKAFLARRLKKQIANIFEEIHNATLESSEDGKRISNAEMKVIIARVSRAAKTGMIILKLIERKNNE